MRQLLTLLDKHAVTGVIVGLPLDAGGAEGDAARNARELAAAIGQRSGRPVELWDERFTTARALQSVREMGGATRGRKPELDALAATVLLQHYLDARRGTAT
jgi:putative Holliday junction resolvase